ncbi:MAG: cofE [Actinobacteria bacterium]|jgi:coenzyme F420-0:L-glutamate ligase/coenzyme F420-1:gamma-L-glutamate ligase|nr:cofE [Actinomycetota bacterium]
MSHADSAAAGPVVLLPIVGIPEVAPGDDLGDLIVEAATASGIDMTSDDVLVVTHKIVSKAEGRILEVDPDDVDARHMVAEMEAARIVRRRGGLLIAETRHGFVCANAGVDASNLEPGQVSLLPVDPDKSARRLRARVRQLTGHAPALIITDTFGRAWRVGQTNVAIGVAGMLPVMDYRGSVDHFGVELKVTTIAIADEIAAAAELVMGKADGVPAAVARGVRYRRGRGNARALIRQPQDDLFR